MKFAENWIGLISNFAKYGNPTPVTGNSGVTWPPAQDSRAACVYLQVGLENQEKHGLFPERMEFWNRVVFRDLLEKYAVSEEEDSLLEEIDIALVESDDDDDDDDDDDEDDDETSKLTHNRLRVNKHKKGGRRGNRRHLMKRKMLKKTRRLAKKL